MVVSEVNYHWNQHWESLFFVSFENVEEIVIFKEAHCSISNLQVNSSNASYYSLEQLWNKVLNFVNFTYLQNFL